MVNIGTVIDEREHVSSCGDGALEGATLTVLLHRKRLGDLSAVREPQPRLPRSVRLVLRPDE